MKKLIIITLIFALSICLGKGIDTRSYKANKRVNISTFLCLDDTTTPILPNWIFEDDIRRS